MFGLGNDDIAQDMDGEKFANVHVSANAVRNNFIMPSLVSVN